MNPGDNRDYPQQIGLEFGDNAPVDNEAPLSVDNSFALSTPEQTTTLLQQWQDAGWLRPLDTGFARLIEDLCQQQGEHTAPLVLLLAALVSHQVGRGHVCIDLSALLADADNTLALPPEDNPKSPAVAPAPLARPQALLARIPLADCQAALAGSSAVSDGRQATPLVLEGNRLYLRRLWRYEQGIAEGIRLRLSLPSALADADSSAANTLSRALQVLFRPSDAVNYQKLACALAARNRFAVVTGGPGTGKTTTVVNLLAALQAVAGEIPERAGRKYRIRLAAPTGKAAARLNESIGGAVRQLPLAELPGQVTLEDIPTRVTTLHRLLGSRPDTRKFRHHQDNPLPVDILVIDEASMVDVDLMASVFAALPARAHLILLGDKDQLASVDAGAVLGELCQRAPSAHYTPATADWLARITGEQLPEQLVDSCGQVLDQAVAMLRKSYRFSDDSGIRQLAEAVNTNTLNPTILQQASNAAFDDVIWLNGHTPQPEPDATRALIARHILDGTPQAFRQQGQGRTNANGDPLPPPVGYGHYLQLLHNHQLTHASPLSDWDTLARTVLEAFSEFQILCALRRGPWGVEGLNQQIAGELNRLKLIERTEGWYQGRPVLITGNDYNLGLMNGDIGITFDWPDPAPAPNKEPLRRVAFPSNDGSEGIRWISPSRLQQLETVYAMTVHKSQGSEFNHTCLVLPDRLSPVLTRELVYTGITRARNWFSLITGDAQVFRDSVEQQVVRASGLALRLVNG